MDRFIGLIVNDTGDAREDLSRLWCTFLRKGQFPIVAKYRGTVIMIATSDRENVKLEGQIQGEQGAWVLYVN